MTSEHEEYTAALMIPDDIRDEMNSRGIDESYIRQVIAYGEGKSRKLVDTRTGRFIAHRKIGSITCWAEYAPEGGGYRLYNTYIHRMAIEGES